MNIFAISGSSSDKSGNYYLLKAIQSLFKDRFSIEVYDGLSDFPLFSTDRLKDGVPENLKVFKNKVVNADVILISTPEYTLNIPAVLKNILEWCTHSGEFFEKKVIPITFTPHAPRGEHAMESLLSSLNALNANVLVQMSIYRTEVEIHEEVIDLSEEIESILMAAFDLF